MAFELSDLKKAALGIAALVFGSDDALANDTTNHVRHLSGSFNPAAADAQGRAPIYLLTMTAAESRLSQELQDAEERTLAGMSGHKPLTPAEERLSRELEEAGARETHRLDKHKSSMTGVDQALSDELTKVQQQNDKEFEAIRARGPSVSIFGGVEQPGGVEQAPVPAATPAAPGPKPSNA